MKTWQFDRLLSNFHELLENDVYKLLLLKYYLYIIGE